MEVLSVSDACRNNDPMRASLGRLIEVVGTPKFEDEIFAAARGAFNCEHISALSVADSASPRILMSATNGTMSIPESGIGILLHVGAMVAVMGVIAVIVYEHVGVAVLRKAWINLDGVWAAAFVVAGVLTLIT